MKTDGNEYINLVNSGLTKREYFAAKAMQGMLANSLTMEVMAKSDIKPDKIYDGIVASADALIKALNKPKTK